MSLSILTVILTDKDRYHLLTLGNKHPTSGLPKDIFSFQSLPLMHRKYGTMCRCDGRFGITKRGVNHNCTAGYRGAQNRVGNANLGQARQVKCYNCNGISHIARNCTQPKRPQNSKYFKDKMLLMQAQENGVQPVHDLALNVDNVFQADDCDAFDSDVYEAPTAHTMFMANLSSADPVYDKAGPSYDLDILSEVQDHDHYQDAVCEHHEEHEMHNDVQPNYVDHVKPKVLAPGKYAIDVEPIPLHNRNNREVHLVYLKHLKESIETLREIIEEAKVKRPLYSSLASACLYTKHSQELLEYVIGTCPKDLNTQDNKHASTPLPKKKQVTFEEQCAMSKSNTHKPVEQLNYQKTNVPVPPSTGVNSCTDASRSQPRSNTKKNRILPAKSVNMKKVEEHPRIIKSSLKTMNLVDSSISSKHTVINLNSHSVCQTCNKCLIFANHDMCVVTYLHSVNASPSVKNVVRKVKKVWKPKQVKQVWKPTGTILTTVGRTDRPLVFGLRLFKTYDGGSLAAQEFHKKVHWDGLGHNLSVGQFCDSDLEVAFRKHSCYVRDTDGVELLKGSRGSNLYTISIEDMMKSSPICLLSKASKNKSWLWQRRLNHLNFGTINDLARKDLVRGLPRLKFEKDHLCSACQLEKSKKHSHKPKTENTNLEVLNTLHMDLCGPMRVQTINGKKYILVIVDDY
ncbi:retrovirus-related pol polyprotein from transposon TNT 1-94 [Tanacetum coccineum]